MLSYDVWSQVRAQDQSNLAELRKKGSIKFHVHITRVQKVGSARTASKEGQRLHRAQGSCPLPLMARCVHVFRSIGESEKSCTERSRRKRKERRSNTRAAASEPQHTYEEDGWTASAANTLPRHHDWPHISGFQIDGLSRAPRWTFRVRDN